MMRAFHGLLLTVLLFGIQQTLTAQTRDPLLGVEVFFKDSAVAKVGDQVVDKYKLLGFPAKVEDVQGDWLWLGRAWVRRGDVMELAEAFDYFVEEVRRNPSSARAWLNRAGCWHSRGELANAIKDYDEAIRLDPKRALPYNNRGTAKSDLKDYEGAIKDYDEAIRLDPKYAPPYNNRGIAKRDLKDYEGAIKDYDEAIRLDPKDAVPYNNRGNAKRNLKDYEGAIKDYDEAIRLDPKYVYAYNNLAFLRATCPDETYRDGGAALRLAKQALEIDSDSGYGWSAKACALAAQGDFDEAAKAQKRALEDQDYADDDEVYGGKLAETRLARWASGQLWTSDIDNPSVASN